MEIMGIPLEFLISQGIFCVLFVWLFADTRKEAKAREDKLTTQIEIQTEAQTRIVSSLERLETKINAINKEE